MIAVISDIHANLEALDATFAAGAKLGVDEWICLGDVVGYGANPNECVERVARLCGVVLLGNHDEAAVGGTDLSWFNPWAAAAAEWTRDVLSSESRRFLAARPYRHDTSAATYVHASPDEPENWHYILSRTDAEAHEAGFAAPLCFVGHSHVPGVYPVGAGETGEPARYIINVGSVGQPRDGDPRACMAIVSEPDDAPTAVQFVRVAYDVAAAQEKIRRAGLPDMLARRLEMGA